MHSLVEQVIVDFYLGEGAEVIREQHHGDVYVAQLVYLHGKRTTVQPLGSREK